MNELTTKTSDARTEITRPTHTIFLLAAIAPCLLGYRSTDIDSGPCRRGPHRPVEGPLADVIDLLLHGLRERHDVGGRVEEVFARQLTLLETGGRQRRHHALLDLGARPALREGLERLEIEARKIDPAPPQMHSEDVEPLVFERQIDEEHFIEAPFANHLGGQQVDAVCGGADEQAARLLLHP